MSSLNRHILNPRLMRHIVLGIMFFAVMCVGFQYASAATFDYLVNAKLEQYQIELGQKPVVYGTVTDNVLRPVSGVEVKITFGANSGTATTDADGKFRLEFPEQQSPGIFSVTVFAKHDGKKGFGGATLRISKQMVTFGEVYYNSEISDFTDQKKSDPYQSLKIKNYEKYLSEKSKADQKKLDIEAKKAQLQEKKELARQSLNQTITELSPGPGTISGYKYDRYMSGLDPSIRDDIASQINYTKNTVDDARAAMKKVLDNGGSLSDARKAYLDSLAIKRDMLEKIAGMNATENHSKIKNPASKASDSSYKVKGMTVKKIK